MKIMKTMMCILEAFLFVFGELLDSIVELSARVFLDRVVVLVWVCALG